MRKTQKHRSKINKKAGIKATYFSIAIGIIVFFLIYQSLTGQEGGMLVAIFALPIIAFRLIIISLIIGGIVAFIKSKKS